MTNVNLIGIIGSRRAGSANGALARAATGILPEQVSLSLHDVSRLPLYNGGEERAGPPADVIALHAAVRDADGIALFSPEYNSSLPAVTENVTDPATLAELAGFLARCADHCRG